MERGPNSQRFETKVEENNQADRDFVKLHKWVVCGWSGSNTLPSLAFATTFLEVEEYRRSAVHIERNRA